MHSDAYNSFQRTPLAPLNSNVGRHTIALADKC